MELFDCVWDTIEATAEGMGKRPQGPWENDQKHLVRQIHHDMSFGKNSGSSLDGYFNRNIFMTTGIRRRCYDQELESIGT